MSTSAEVAKALLSIEGGISYSVRLKRKYEAALVEKSDCPESVTPMEELPSISSTCASVFDVSAVQYVEEYIEKNEGKKIDWKYGLNTGVEKGLIKSYVAKKTFACYVLKTQKTKVDYIVMFDMSIR